MPLPRLSCKRVGEIAELAFIARAAELGFLTMKPHGDSAPYDVVLDNGRRLLRVQVKWVGRANRGIYQVHTCHGREQRPYKRSELDFLAAYIVPAKLWFIVPIEEFAGRPAFCLPRDLRSPYREAWRLLLAAPIARRLPRKDRRTPLKTKTRR